MKLHFSMLMLCLVLAISASSQTTRYYEQEDIIDLLNDLKNSANGDIFELTSSGGIYVIDTLCFEVNTDITIKAAPNLAERPVVKLVYNQDFANQGKMIDYLVRLNGGDVSLTLDGIDFQGDKANTKYAIRTGKISDLSGYSDYKDIYYQKDVIQYYSLHIYNCTFSDIKQGTDGRGIRMYPGTRARLIKIENSTFSNIERQAIDAYCDNDEIIAKGHWLFADSIAVINSTFHHLGREAIQIRTSDTSTFSMQHKLYMNHVTIDTCGWNNADPKKYHALKIEYVQASISNSSFTNDVSTDYLFRFYNSNSTADNIGYFNNAGIEGIRVNNGAYIGTNSWTENPLYATSINGDYTLSISSPFLGKATDGFAIGDLRWDPTVVPINNADLKELKVDGTDIQGFTSDVLNYQYEIPYGTTVVPTISSAVLNSKALAFITQANTIQDTAYVLVISEDGSQTKTYKVSFIEIGTSDSDTRLSDLKIDGKTIDDFSYGTIAYTVELPIGTTNIPLVTATSYNQNATVQIQPATSIPGTTQIIVIAVNSTAQVYSVNFKESNPLSSDATLSELKINGSTISGFNTNILNYTKEFPYGTIQVPYVSATPTDDKANVSIIQANSIPGEATILVTAEDGKQQTYKVNFTETPPGTDATLSNLQIDGSTIVGFSPSVLTYTLEFPYGTSVIPTVTATQNDAKAIVAITPATSMPGETSILVTAEDGTQQEYKVSFIVTPPNSDASLSDLKVDNITVNGFDSGTYVYRVSLKNGTTKIPIVTVQTTDNKASFVVIDASSLPGETAIYVTAEDGSTNVYKVIFTVTPVGTDATLSDLQIDGNTVEGFDALVFRYTYEMLNGSTNVPTVNATSSDSKAKVAVIDATSIPGETSVLVTAEDNSWQTYKVIFIVEPLNNDATLSDLQLDRETIEGFNSLTLNYTVEIPHGADIPSVTPYTSDVDATVSISPATSIPGVTYIYVKAEDGTTKVYSINFIEADPLSRDATLSALLVNGTSVEGFASNNIYYTVNLPYGTNEIPEVLAYKNDSKADIQYLPAEALPGRTQVVVVAEDGVTQNIYTVVFNYGSSSISNLENSGVKIFANAGTLYLDGNEELMDGKLEVYDLMGRKLLSSRIDGEKEQFVLRNRGVVVVRIFDKQNNLKAIRKVSIE